MAARQEAESSGAARRDGGCTIFDFDICAELLRGEVAALGMHARRMKLHLEAMGRPIGPEIDDPLEPLGAMPDPWAEPPGAGLVSPVYEF